MTPSTRTPDRYDLLSRILHWSVAALVLAQFALGWTMPDVHGTAPPVGLVAWHVALGTALIVVIAARLLWSIVRRSRPRISKAPCCRSRRVRLTSCCTSR